MKNNLSQKLSEHFTLREFVRSATAERLHIDNTPGWEHVARLCHLCQRVLEPLRHRFGRIVITSGYRCPRLNRAVGGVSNSQHMRGEAADIRVVDMVVGMQMFNFIRECCDYDQLLFEHSPRTGGIWLHVSCRTAGNNRHQAIIQRSPSPAQRSPSPTLPQMGRERLAG